MKRLLHQLWSSQSGFTAVELLAAVAITAFISLGAAVSSLQLINQTSRDTNYTAASQQAASAIQWMSRDALMAQRISGYAAFPQSGNLTFSWTAWDNTVYTAVYTLHSGTLKRTYAAGEDASVTTVIARYIDATASATFCSYADGVFTITVTATAGSGDRATSVTKTREVTNRPGL